MRVLRALLSIPARIADLAERLVQAVRLAVSSAGRRRAERQTAGKRRTEDNMPGFKFAALVLPTSSGPTGSRSIHEGKETLVGTLSSLVAAEELAHWREWLGSLAWDKIDRGRRLVILRSPAAAPSVLDDDNQRLLGKVSNAWRAFLLCEPHINTEGESWLLSGEAAGNDPDSQLVSVRTVSRIDAIVRPLHATRARFWEVNREDWREQVQRYGGPDESWFLRWIEIDNYLCSGPWSEVLGYALLAHGSARTRPELEFAIPELVRAAEGVIALERRMGAQVFKDRALRLVPSLRNDRYVGTQIEPLLLDLYQARSDCVHGKVPFLKLRALGDEGEERAAQLAYVADVLAREALLVAFRFPDKSIFATREVLEAAWASNAFPERRA